jgi:hypothetical protein
MPRNEATRLALTVGQLARRWGVSADRVRQLVRAGRLPGAFTIPSAGRYAATLKVPLAVVVRVETEDWAVAPESAESRPKPRRPQGDRGPALRHFPRLTANGPPADGCPGDAPG